MTAQDLRLKARDLTELQALANREGQVIVARWLDRKIALLEVEAQNLEAAAKPFRPRPLRLEK